MDDMQLREIMCSRVRELREARKLGRKALAAAIGCDYGNYCRYEKGERQFPFEILETVSSYFGVTIDYLFGREPVGESELTRDEINLVESFRRVPPGTQQDIISFLQMKALQRLEKQDR